MRERESVCVWERERERDEALNSNRDMQSKLSIHKDGCKYHSEIGKKTLLVQGSAEWLFLDAQFMFKSHLGRGFNNSEQTWDV